MKKGEKINYLVTNHWKVYDKKYRKVEDKLSSQQGIMCLCGRLATGLHESNCQRFRHKIESETIKALKHLINN